MTDEEIEVALAQFSMLLKTLQKHAAHLQGVLEVCEEVGLDKAREAMNVDGLQAELNALYEVCRLTETARGRLLTLR